MSSPDNAAQTSSTNVSTSISPNYSSLDVAKKNIKKLMSSACLIMNTSFEDAELAANCQTPGSIQEDYFDCINEDPPYEERRLSNKVNSSHDKLSDAQIAKNVKFHKRILKHGAKVLTFCNLSLLNRLCKFYSESKEFINDDPSEREVPCFRINKKPIHLIWAPGHKHTGHHKQFDYNSTVEYIFSARRTRYGAALEPSLQVKPGGYVPCQQPAHVDVIDNIQRLAPGEAVMKPHPSMPGRFVSMRPEQKPLPLVRECLHRYTPKAQRVFDGFCGTGTSAVAAIKSPTPIEFVGTEADTDCFNAAVIRVETELCRAIVDGTYAVLNNSRLVSKRTKNIIKSIGVDLLRASAAVVLQDLQSKTKASAWKKEWNRKIWSPPTSFPAYTTIPLELVAPYLAYCKVPVEPVSLSNKSLDKWDSDLQGYIQSIPLDVRRTINRISTRTEKLYTTHRETQSLSTNFINPTSSMSQDNAGKGIVTLSSYCAGNTITSIHGHLLYDDISNTGKESKMYGRGSILVSPAQFRHYNTKINISNVHADNRMFEVAYFVPASDHIVSQCRFVSDDTANTFIRFKDNVETLDNLSPHTNYNLVAKHDISAGSEILIEM